ncbi:M15 family metallopeptidase [Aquimarina sp. MMG016]|uniref:M15 family metallopeptidase n=1 Tax=Aquimarina sp. MMG016 TaxID=2822690 RepID=UPI001B3A6C14|nr:M15 family metallopeptidase [Aquimarina sp. MMG016]MBQ4822272.1 M15 family metallopeptidase [Aquimarina sp. MMG016]
MQRRNFIKTNAMVALGLSLTSFSMFQSQFSKDDLMGKSDPTLYGHGYKLQKEVYEAFLKMKAEAAKSGIKIKVVSSYRNYAHQNRIWERKYKKFTSEGLSPIQVIKKIVEYSTIPGTSRHHWGTDLDIVDGNPPQPKGLLLEKNFENNGPFCKFKEWMDKHAESFGFYLVYTDMKDRKGFKYEPWHYSYASLSIPMLKEYQKLDIKTELQKAKLMGSSHFTEDFIQQYIKENIFDINPQLL